MEHKWRILVAAENLAYGDLDYYHWCENCGTVKVVSGNTDKQTLFYTPFGDGKTPNSQECVNG